MNQKAELMYLLMFLFFFLLLLSLLLLVQVLYVPSAQKLIEGGLFHKGDDGLFETPEVAKALLRSMVTNHGKDLEKLTGSSGEALLKVCTTYYLTILFILIIYYHHH